MQFESVDLFSCSDLLVMLISTILIIIWSMDSFLLSYSKLNQELMRGLPRPMRDGWQVGQGHHHLRMLKLNS